MAIYIPDVNAVKITIGDTNVDRVYVGDVEVRPILRSWEYIISLSQADAVAELNKHPYEYRDKFSSEGHTANLSSSVVGLNHYRPSSSSTYYQIQWKGWTFTEYNWGWSGSGGRH